MTRDGRVGSHTSGHTVALVVKQYAGTLGLEPAAYSVPFPEGAHATVAAIADASERSIMRQTGHRSVQMVRRYIRRGNLFRGNSAGLNGCGSAAGHLAR